MRASPQKREEKERVRHALLRAALSLGAQHGFASLGLREVSRAAAIAPTSFYRHFTDMSELGLALVDELVRPLLSTLVERATGASASAASVVDGMFAAVGEDAELVRFVVAERAGAFANLRAALTAELERVSGLLHAAGKSRASGLSKARSIALADATIALILEGFGRALDLPPAEREAIRERLVGSLSLVFAEPPSRGGNHE